jgi:hypothetical protein
LLISPSDDAGGWLIGRLKQVFDDLVRKQALAGWWVVLLLFTFSPVLFPE